MYFYSPSNEPFHVSWRRYQHLCSSRVTEREAKRLYWHELRDGVFWRERLDKLLFLHRVCYCICDEPDVVYLMRWNGSALSFDKAVYVVPEKESVRDIVRDILGKRLEEE